MNLGRWKVGWWLAWLLVSAWSVQGQSKLGVAFYELGPLYDTLPSPYHQDEEYLEGGRLGWSGERYRRAVAQNTALLDSMAMPVVGLFGVENEAVALDLAARGEMCYTVLHRTSNRFDGQDLALLYQSDRLFPAWVEEGYGWMGVACELDGRAVVILLVSDDRYLSDCLARLRDEHPERELLVMGRIDPQGDMPLQDALAEAERRGRGSCRRKGGWLMRHRILHSEGWQSLQGDVYARHWLFDERRGEPLPLYRGERYLGGYSRNLPVFVYLRANNLED